MKAKTYTRNGKLNKKSKKYFIVHDLWLETEEYLCNNRYAPIKKIHPGFYEFLIKNKFSNDWDCWSICEKYVTGKSYKPYLKFKIVPYGKNEFALKSTEEDKIIAIRNTKKQVTEVMKYLNGK